MKIVTKMWSVLGLLIFLPMRALLSIVPKDKNILVFGAWRGKQFSDNPYYFLKYLLSIKAPLKLIVVTHDKAIINRFRNTDVEIYSPYSIRGLLAVVRAGTIFITHSVESDINYITTSKNQTVVNFWHGTPLKDLKSLGSTFINQSRILNHAYVSAFKIASMFLPPNALVITTNALGQNKLSEFLRMPKEKVKILGYPRNDNLSTKIHKIKKLGNYKKIITYLPTYREDVSGIQKLVENFKRLNTILKKNDYVFTYKTHPATKLNTNKNHRYSNILPFEQLFDGNKAHSAFEFTDILITDYSGLVFDFMLTKRPVIYYCYDLEEYSQDPGFTLDYVNDLPGPFAENIDSLFSLIKNIEKWTKSKKYSDNHEKMNKIFNPRKEKNYSETIYNFLLEEKIIEL